MNTSAKSLPLRGWLGSNASEPPASSRTVLPSEALFEESLREGQTRHALKTALACVISVSTAYYFHVPSEQLAPVFTFLLFTLGMPSPRMNWLLTQLAVFLSAIGSAIILVFFHNVFFLYLALTLLWIIFCLSLSGWLPLPGTMAGMITAISLFTFLDGGVGAALDFFVDYNTNFLIAGLSIIVVHTLVWPLNTPKVFVSRLAQAYAHLESECRAGSHWLRSGGSPPPPAPFEDWAPFRPLKQLVAPELFRRRETTSPFAGLILACRGLNLRLWFFNHAFGHVPPVELSADSRRRLADRLDGCATQLANLATGALEHKPVASVSPELLRDIAATDEDSRQSDPLVAHNIPGSVLALFGRDLETATKFHNKLFAHFGHGFHGELVNLWPGPNAAGLFNTQSIQAGVKLVLILVLLLLEEGWLGLPGGTQVAFFATFFASTANLGRQTKTDVVDIVGLLSGFCYGVVAAFITSRLPHFPLLIVLVFLGQFLADLAYQRLPLYSFAGIQAGLAIPFTFLATVGPEWGSFTMVRTRLAGLLVAGFTAVIVHAFVWPVLPLGQLRASIAAALRSTADTLTQLFTAPRSTWQGPPPSLRDTILRARDLLDDARYLPGPEHADATYATILTSLQTIDASLEYIHLLVCIDPENPTREQFFTTLADYPAVARENLAAVAAQFQDPPRRTGSIAWPSDATERWDRVAPKTQPPTGSDLRRLVVIASCFDEIAAATNRISENSCEINTHSKG